MAQKNMSVLPELRKELQGRKLADVGDDLKPAFDTVTAELSGSA